MALQKKRWADLTPRQKRVIIAGGVVQYSLLAAAWVDLVRRPASKVNGDKRLWALGSLVSFFGPVAYFVFGRARS